MYVGTQAATDALSGRLSSSDTYLRRALAGSIVGIFSGASTLMLADAGLLGVMGGGFAEGFAGEAITQKLLNEDGEIDWAQCIRSGVFTALMNGFQQTRISNIKNSGDTYFVGDATFMDADDKFVKFIQKRGDIDANDCYDIIAHGTPYGIQITHNGQHIIVDHRIAAQLIQNADGYNGQAIRLLSCNTGALDDGFAQNLANKLNVKVYAPTNYLWATETGDYFVAGMTCRGLPDKQVTGKFKIFSPGGNQ